ncbi:integumentary mucin C.1-like isoform X2 [Anoplophora glabripennis]|uniref:integumentary mucin C.1-like isoform X2 n=1 Tax=Anoplophora glabripennis TaxID=217634 RepID=UPI00087554B2|nr:integumentary mucin C.1-like isoform X2 [Anoplophora glabripennis]
MKFSFWVTLAVLSATAMSETILDGTPCENTVVCLSDSTFSFCFLINDGQEELQVGNFTCASGKECVQGANNPCHEALIEGQTKNTTSKSLVDSCETQGICKHAANNCNQYYELVLQSCPSGESFSRTELKCTSEEACTETNSSTETPSTQSSPSNEEEDCGCTPPTCTGTGKYPSENCSQYYECIDTDTGYELVIQTCSSGQAFNRTQLVCVVDEICGRENNSSGTTSSVASTTQATVVTPPTCLEPGRLPCQECNQYYECTPKEDGSFEISLETCPTGQAYSNTQQECFPDDSCIPVVTESTTIHSVTPPTCTGPGRLPCQECNQYYECTEKEDGSFEISLETCSSGHAYNNTQQDCVPDDTCAVETIDTTTSEPCGCNTTEPEIITTTEAPVTAPAECTSASKYPSQNCNQYYECVQFLWWYFLNLYTCPSGQAFDTTELLCVANYRCNAETGKIESETTTKPSTTSSTSTTTTTTPITTTTTPTSTTTTPTATTTAPTTTTTSPTTTTAIPNPTSTTLTTTTTTPDPTTTTPTTTITIPTTTTPTTTPTTTTTKPTTTTTTQATPPSSCTGADKYPAPACNQYYECLEVMYWYELVVQTCESGHSYSECLKICVADETCNP